MTTDALIKSPRVSPSIFDEFFKPWNEWFSNDAFSGRTFTVPAVNIAENKNEYQVSLAAPGLKKEDFKINLEGNILTISSEKEENKEEKDERFNRKEYSYTSFTRSFTMPEEINMEMIKAVYEDGVLKIDLPKTDKAKVIAAKKIEVK